MKIRSFALTALLGAAPLVAPATGLAQDRPEPVFADAAAQEQEPVRNLTPPSGLRPLRVAKWSAATTTVVTATYGFTQQRAADRRYLELERACHDDLPRCADRMAGGEFMDPDLEAKYQDIVRMDRNARMALLASQVAVVSSVILFLLDLRADSGPPNVPYEPPLRLGVRDDGAVELQLAWPRAR